MAAGQSSEAGTRAAIEWADPLAAAAFVAIFVVAGVLDRFLHAGEEQGLTPSGWDSTRAGGLAVLRALVSHQRSGDGDCARGSWDPEDKWGAEGGRVCATALNAMTLQAPAARK